MSKVATTYGTLEGEQVDGLHVFKGVPFAAPPVGHLRWRAPERPARWTGTRPALQFGNESWQPGLPSVGPFAPLMDGRAEPSEDCLYLNVWTPGLDDRGRPVLVWIHGGAFILGAGSQQIYDGAALARRGNAVVVTINYRLGVLGFCNLDAATDGRIPATGNEGLLDQVMALQWVKANIERFGGDPGNVTIFGESAGGMSVGALLGMPAAKGLFHRAIPQSGASSTANPLQRAAEATAGFLADLDVQPSDTAALLALDPAQLAVYAMKYMFKTGMVFQPCIDGKVLPQLPLDAVRAGSADGVSVLVGTTREEWRLFAAMNMTGEELTDDKLADDLARSLPNVDVATLIERYRRALEGRGEPTAAVDLHAAIETDRMFRLPAIRLAEALAARHQRVYQYLFTWPSPAFGGMLQSCHAIDLGFVFGTHAVDEALAGFFGAGPAADALCATVQDAWVNFARTGNPQCDALPNWPIYETRRRSTALLGDPAEIATAPLDAERRIWDGVPDSAIGHA